MNGRRRLFLLILLGESETINRWVEDGKDHGLFDVVRIRKAGSHTYLRIVEEDTSANAVQTKPTKHGEVEAKT